jgi:membrane-bound metal-dependent hydrolase YbcI (DUF457 family)
MNPKRPTPTPDEGHWLQAEQSGQEELAEILLARLVTQLPAIEPSAAFVDRAFQAAWRTRTHRRRVRVALVAAAALIATAGIAAVYALAPFAMGLIVSGTVMISHSLVWLVTSAGEGARWWWIAERIGTAVLDTISAPSAASAITAVEMILLLVIYAFRHVLGKDYEKHALEVKN